MHLRVTFVFLRLSLNCSRYQLYFRISTGLVERATIQLVILLNSHIILLLDIFKSRFDELKHQVLVYKNQMGTTYNKNDYMVLVSVLMNYSLFRIT